MRRIMAATAFAAMLWAGVPATAGAQGEVTYVPRADPTFALKRSVVFDKQGFVHPRWMLGAVVEDFDRRFAALNMWVGSCRKHPNAGCVRVDGVNRPAVRWWGLYNNLGHFRATIKLNKAGGRNRVVTCHEVGHALGLEHHRVGGGCLQAGRFAKRPSQSEMTALRTSYTSYRAQSALWPL